MNDISFPSSPSPDLNNNASAGIMAVLAGDVAEASGEMGEEEEDDGKEAGVPHFWMQCMLHHEALHDVVWYDNLCAFVWDRAV